MQRCEAIGLHPAIGSGVHLKPADGAFAEFLRAYGVPEPEPVKGVKLNPKGKPLDWWADPRERRKGRSTLAKWTCGCQNVRVGTKEFHAQFLRCGNEFRKVNGQDEAEPGQADGLPTQRSGWSQGTLDLSQGEGGIDNVGDAQPRTADMAIAATTTKPNGATPDAPEMPTFPVAPQATFLTPNP